MAWRLAKGLAKLRSQINEKWPDRNKASDGTIGDAAHSSRVSQHNPDSQGRVRAFDITHDPEHGAVGTHLAEALIKDFRTLYVIWSGRIWKSKTGKWEAYKGVNPHNKHVHISIKSEHADDERTWALTTEIPPISYPTLKLHSRGEAVRDLQRRLNSIGYKLDEDGIFGFGTLKAVQNFQRANDLIVDGIFGQASWKVLNELTAK